MSGGLDIAFLAEGTEENPRHGGVSMVELKDGSIFLVKMLFHRSRLQHQAGDDAPADLEALISRDGGRTWGERRILMAPGPDDVSMYSPSLLRLRSGKILFRYEIYHHFIPGEPCCISAFACVSSDECAGFSPPVTIWKRSAHHMGFPHDMVQLSGGRVLAPSCYDHGVVLAACDKGPVGEDAVEAGGFYSDDEGESWKECDNYVYLPMRGAMEPMVAELTDGRLLMVVRTQLGSLFKSYSSDGGQTWSNAQTTGLSSCESCPALVRIPQTGDLLLVWNHSLYDPKFDHSGFRTPLTVAISKDEGRTWGGVKDIETDPEWEFTNPQPLVTRRGTVLIAYEASKYASVTPPGRLGRSRMHQKLAIVGLDWLYQ